MSVFEIVRTIVAKQIECDPAELSETTDLFEVGFESLDIVEIIFLLEKTFKIDIPVSRWNNDELKMQTIGDVVNLVENLSKVQNKL